MFWNKKKKRDAAIRKEVALRTFRKYVGAEVADNSSCISKPKFYMHECNLLWVYIDYIYEGRWSNYACYLDATTLEHVDSAYDHTG
jgi:hypothetical protein